MSYLIVNPHLHTVYMRMSDDDSGYLRISGTILNPDQSMTTYVTWFAECVGTGMIECSQVRSNELEAQLMAHATNTGTPPESINPLVVPGNTTLN